MQVHSIHWELLSIFEKVHFCFCRRHPPTDQIQKNYYPFLSLSSSLFHSFKITFMSPTRSQTCSCGAAPSLSPPALVFGWGRIGTRWRSRGHVLQGRSRPVRPEPCRSPAVHAWQTSREGDSTGCHPLAADTNNTWRNTKGEKRWMLLMLNSIEVESKNGQKHLPGRVSFWRLWWPNFNHAK